MTSLVKNLRGLRAPNPSLMVKEIIDIISEWPIIIGIAMSVVLFVLDVKGDGGILIASISFIWDLLLIIMFSATTFIEYENRFNYRQDKADALIGACIFLLVLTVTIAVAGILL